MTNVNSSKKTLYSKGFSIMECVLTLLLLALLAPPSISTIITILQKSHLLFKQQLLNSEWQTIEPILSVDLTGTSLSQTNNNAVLLSTTTDSTEYKIDNNTLKRKSSSDRYYRKLTQTLQAKSLTIDNQHCITFGFTNWETKTLCSPHY